MANDNEKMDFLRQKLKEASELFLSMDAAGAGEDKAGQPNFPGENDGSISSGIPGADALMHWMQNRPASQLAPVEGEDLATALLTAMAALDSFDDAVAAGLDSRQSISGEWFVERALEDSDGSG
jgi:hypothetical protein